MPSPTIKPAYWFAQQFGVKSIVYGPPGKGKTPICDTAPSPLLCSVEPGMLSMRTSQIPACEAYTPEAINDFFEWLKSSNEAKKYQTICIDSMSQVAEIYLTSYLKNNKDPRAAYGKMAIKVMEHCNQLYFTREKNTYLICKQMIVQENYTDKAKPYFPGKDLNVQIPHLFDVILHINVFTFGNIKQVCFHTLDDGAAVARDRSGKLAEYEPTNLTTIFNKILQG